jgi:hypothetical protein
VVFRPTLVKGVVFRPTLVKGVVFRWHTIA